MNRIGMALLLTGCFAPFVTAADAPLATSKRYKALDCPPVSLAGTWALLERDGANREVEPYLSSLGQGEAGTGVIASPPFVVSGDAIVFTIRGHDGPGGGKEKNYIALVDVRKGKTLLQTPAPGNDALQERRWDVAKYRGMEVRIEVHDGDTAGAFAWLGIGKIDASPALKIDFRQGIPKDWVRHRTRAAVSYEMLQGGVPFRRDVNRYSIMSKTNPVELPCGFLAKRLFLLGCSAAGGRPPLTYGAIELHYQSGDFDTIPLICGVTLDAKYKRLSNSDALMLHASTDPYQPYLAISTRQERLEKIRLITNTVHDVLPQVTAITCETDSSGEHLIPLPASEPDEDEAAWIEARSVTPLSLKTPIRQAIGQAEQAAAGFRPTEVKFRKIQLDRKFRSEGVAVADFNGDGHPDIAAGNVYYAGPAWRMVPMRGAPASFPLNSYSDAFLCFPDDVDHDGDVDLIVVGFPNRETHWLRNPGESAGVWDKHLAVEKTGNESPAYVDLDGDGSQELVYMSGGRCVAAKPGPDPTAIWTTTSISGAGEPAPAHGLGIGDIDGDGRTDVLTPNGWWKGPETMRDAPWSFHAAEFFGGAQLCVADLDGDGDNDVLGSSAHGHGIGWTEQTPDGWQIHMIEADTSQTHALHMADINRDGRPDFVTGKRFWAHNSHDPGSYEPCVLQWFESVRGAEGPKWIRRTIDSDAGVGLHFQIIDINGDGRLDIVTSNKKGVNCFEQF